MVIKNEISPEDIEYVLSHLQTPEKLMDPDFLEWLKDEEHRQIFDEIRRHREVFLYHQYSGQVDVAGEWMKFMARTRPVFLRKSYYWTAAACVVILFTSVLFMTGRKQTEQGGLVSSEVPVGKKSAELFLANGECVALEHTHIQIKEADGTVITNDKSQKLTYLITKPETECTARELVYNTLKVPAGADYFIQLSDGSKVWVNCESNLRFPVQFGSKERVVFLDGEAYFEVNKSAEWPFVVVTDKMSVKVTGTRFNVKSYSQENIIHTTLVSGAVDVNHFQLKPGQQFSLDKKSDKSTVCDVDAQLFTGWVDGAFVFKAERLEDVMNNLAKWYKVSVFYQNEAVKDIRFSGNLGRYDTIDQVLDIIRAFDKVDIVRNGYAITISSK